MPDPIIDPEALAKAWGIFRDGPDYQPTDRYDIRAAFEAGWAAAQVTAQTPAQYVAGLAEDEALMSQAARLVTEREGIIGLDLVAARYSRALAAALAEQEAGRG